MVMTIMDMEDALCQIFKKGLLHKIPVTKYCHVICETINRLWIGE
jgi:hypothetical protein